MRRVLPRHAVRHGNEVALAIQKNDQSILKRLEIKILWRNEKVVVTRSLQPGDVLITEPIDYATNNQPLKVRIEGETGKGKPKRQ